jgi:1-aminocyclopropane-1-carboxylate deaminase/D-cysteine desulfhydrase-like pyridoxal-dependent ACC family enzyme
VNALFRAWPQLAGRVPWRELGAWPTLVERAPALGAEVWVKRDDRSSPLYGGNKVRKLEFLLADALARGRRSVLTFGTYGSHHVLATALHGARVGVRVCAATLPQPATPHAVEMARLSAGAGVCLHVGAARVHHLLRRPYIIGPGGSSPLGTLGYVAAGLELGEQVRAGECPEPNLLVVAMGSCGTAAGLLVGLRLAGLATRVVGVHAYRRPLTSAVRAAWLATRTARLLARHGVRDVGAFAAADLVEPPPAADEVHVKARADEAGLVLDPRYTTRAMRALLAAAPGRRILYWHTYSSAPVDALVRVSVDELPAGLRTWAASCCSAETTSS